MRNKHRTSYPKPQELAEQAVTTERKEDCSRGTIWTDDEVAWLKANYHRFPGKFCAEHLRRSYISVRVMIYRLRHGRTSQTPRKTVLIPGNVSRLSDQGVTANNNA